MKYANYCVFVLAVIVTLFVRVTAFAQPVIEISPEKMIIK